jgi:hypothetical protein
MPASITRRRFVLPALIGAVLLVTGAATGYLTAPSPGLRLPPAGNAPPATTTIHGTVQSVSANSLTVSSPAGPVALKLSLQTAFERLDPATLAAVRVGDWVNVAGVPNRQTLFAITGLAVIPADRLRQRP